MEDGKRLASALKLLATALVLGICGDLFLGDGGWGLGVFLFGIAVFAGSLVVCRESEQPIARSVRWLAVPTLGFAALFMWRDAPELKFLNSISILLLVGVIAHRARLGIIHIGTIMDYPFKLIERWFVFIADAVPVVNLQGKWKELGEAKNGKTIRSVMLGLVLATPLILLFGALFVSADANFEHLVNRAFSFDLESMWNHGITIAICFWLVAGFLQRVFFTPDPYGPPRAPTSKPSNLGIVEIGIVLGMLDLLFAAFVATQFRHLFGGNEVVRDTANLGYAQYARRGFFELSTVAILVLPVLLGAHALLRRDNPKAERVYNVLASVLVGLVFLVIHSAVLRMRLYVEAYGISQLRIYVLASIAWIGAVFVWFVSTVIRGKTDRFAFGGLALFLTTVIGLNIINPDGLVARVNTTRATGNVDASYLSSLSDDASGELVRALPRLSADAQKSVLTALGKQNDELQKRSWKEWTLSGSEAARALAGRTYPRPEPPKADPSTDSSF